MLLLLLMMMMNLMPQHTHTGPDLCSTDLLSYHSRYHFVFDAFYVQLTKPTFRQSTKGS